MSDDGSIAVSLSVRLGRIEVRVRNTSAGELWFPGVVDGSETASRYPHYLPSIRFVPTGDVVAEPPPAEDPLTGPLRPTDFQRLAPGEEFDPAAPGRFLPLSTFANHRPSRRGIYRYILTIDTTGEDPATWVGTFGHQAYAGEVLPLLAKVPRVRTTATLDS